MGAIMIKELDRITSHASYNDINKILSTLENIDTSKYSIVHVDVIRKLNETIVFFKYALDSVEPWHVSLTTLSNIHSHTSQILSNLTAFINNNHESYINAINSSIDGLLIYLSQLLIVKTPEDIEGVKESVISLRRSISQHLSNIDKESSTTSNMLIKNQEKINDLSSAIDNQKTRIDSIINDFQNQFLQTQDNRSSEFNEFLKSHKDQHEKLMAEHKETFNDICSDFQNQSDIIKSEIDTLINEFRNNFNNELSMINEMNKEAEKTLGAMSMKSLASGYQRISRNEWVQSIIWNIFSVASIIAVLWFSYKFIILYDGELSWITLISRGMLTGIGVTLFAYCAKQASNHRIEERRNRKIQLELASLNPYIKDLDDKDQKEIKQALIAKYFVGDSTINEASNNNSTAK